MTDNNIPVPLSPSTGPFQISILLLADTPQIATSDLNVPAGLETGITTTNVAVTDADTPDAGVLLTLTSTPTQGHVEVRTAGNVRNPLLVDQTFSLAELKAGDVFYVHDAGIGDSTDDALTLMVSDGDPATVDSSATLTVIVVPRTDNPVSQGSRTASLVGYLDAAVSRSQPASNSVTGTPPWNSVLLSTAIDYAAATVPADPNRCAISFTVTTLPTLGVLKTPSGDNAPFTQAEVTDGLVTYQNFAFSNLTDSFVIQASDCILQSTLDTVLITRQIDVDSDVGWVLDTQWSDSAGSANRACTLCHTGSGALSNDWRESGTLVIHYCNLIRGITNRGATYPSTTGHGGGRVIGNPSNPLTVLQQWVAEGFPFPPPPVICP